MLIEITAETKDHFKMVARILEDNNFTPQLIPFCKNRGWDGEWILWYDDTIWKTIGLTYTKRDKTFDKKEPFLWATIVIVIKEYRGKGYGTNIMGVLKNRAVQTKRMLVVDPDTKRNERFYSKLGFEYDNKGKPDCHGQVMMTFNSIKCGS